MTSVMISAIEHLVNLLKIASTYYYNGGELLLDNTSYDALLEEIRILDPNNPFLTTIGCPPLKPLCFLPAYMPLKRVSASPPQIIYENHDGLIALWCPTTKSLYLRANERQGKSIRAIVPHIRGLIYNSTDNWMIRGNLVISKKVIKRRLLARSALNTLLYMSDATKIDPDFLSNISFIPYQVISPSQPTPQKQFEWLAKQGFQVPWWIPNEESPSLYYLRRRIRSEYHIKGMTII